jgi:hypothetical protein
MIKYRCLFLGDFYRNRLIDGKLYDDHNFYNFQIEVIIPIDYDTEEEATHCPCSLRFELDDDGHAVLRIYSDWKQGIDKNGEWFEHVDGNIIDTIKWEEHWKYKISKSKVISKNMKLVCDGLTDYVPDATPWDELFDIENQPKGWVNTVEPYHGSQPCRLRCGGGFGN